MLHDLLILKLIIQLRKGRPFVRLEVKCSYFLLHVLGPLISDNV